MKDQILKWIEENKAECLDCVLLQNGSIDDWNSSPVIDVNEFIEFLDSITNNKTI